MKKTEQSRRVLKNILSGKVPVTHAQTLLSADGWYWNFQVLNEAERECSDTLLIGLFISMPDDDLRSARLTEKEVMLVRLLQAKSYLLHPHRPRLMQIDISTQSDQQLKELFDSIQDYPSPFQAPGTG